MSACGTSRRRPFFRFPTIAYVALAPDDALDPQEKLLPFTLRPETGPTIRTLALPFPPITPHEAEQIYGAVKVWSRSRRSQRHVPWSRCRSNRRASHATNEAGHVPAGRFILMVVSLLPSRHSIEEGSGKSGLELRSRGQSSRQFRDCRRCFAHKSLLLRPAPRRRPTHISPPPAPPLSRSPRRRSRRFRSSSHRKIGGRRPKAAWLPAPHQATGCREGLALSPHTSKRVNQSGTPSTDRLLQARSVTPRASYSCPSPIVIELP
jgi:hypothetical protein